MTPPSPGNDGRRRGRPALLVVAAALLTVGADCVPRLGESPGGPLLINNSGHNIRVVQVQDDGDEVFITDLSDGGDAHLGGTAAGGGCNERTYVVRTRPEGQELARREPGTMCGDGAEGIIEPPDPAATTN